MKYKGVEIGKPTLEMIQEYINRERFTFPAIIAYNYFEKELWQTKKGLPYQSLECAINVYNGIHVQRQRKTIGFVGSLF